MKIIRKLGSMAFIASYLLIGLEMFIMISPFAAYYYGVYAPFLETFKNQSQTGWLVAFFLPHLSSRIFSGVGGFLFYVGGAAFLLGALQLYYVKILKKGVSTHWIYAHIRHPQYLFLGISGFGLLLAWPRFIILILFVTMLFVYYLLAVNEEQRVKKEHGDEYKEYENKTSRFIPGEPGHKIFSFFFGWIKPKGLALFSLYVVSLLLTVTLAFALRGLTISYIPKLYLKDRNLAVISLSSKTDLQGITRLVLENPEVNRRLNSAEEDGRLGFTAHIIEGKKGVEHFLIDAGVNRSELKKLPVPETGKVVVFSKVFSDREGGVPVDEFLSVRLRRSASFMATLGEEGNKVTALIDLPAKYFRGNNAMPIF